MANDPQKVFKLSAESQRSISNPFKRDLFTVDVMKSHYGPTWSTDQVDADQIYVAAM